jgi:hypothetical protein
MVTIGAVQADSHRTQRAPKGGEMGSVSWTPPLAFRAWKGSCRQVRLNGWHFHHVSQVDTYKRYTDSLEIGSHPSLQQAALVSSSPSVFRTLPSSHSLACHPHSADPPHSAQSTNMVSSLTAALLAAPLVVNAHYIFSQLVVNDELVGSDYTYIRQNTNSYEPSITDDVISSNNMRCNCTFDIAIMPVLDV